MATADTDAPNSVREVFVNQASAEGIGQGLTDALLTAMGGKGKYAIVSCGQTAAEPQLLDRGPEVLHGVEVPGRPDRRHRLRR